MKFHTCNRKPRNWLQNRHKVCRKLSDVLTQRTVKVNAPHTSQATLFSRCAHTEIKGSFEQRHPNIRKFSSVSHCHMDLAACFSASRLQWTPGYLLSSHFRLGCEPCINQPSEGSWHVASTKGFKNKTQLFKPWVADDVTSNVAHHVRQANSKWSVFLVSVQKYIIC